MTVNRTVNKQFFFADHPICVQTNNASGDDVHNPSFCGKKCQMVIFQLFVMIIRLRNI